MTRYVRAGNSQKHQKTPEDATSWETFFDNSKSKDKDSNVNKIKARKINSKSKVKDSNVNKIKARKIKKQNENEKLAHDEKKTFDDVEIKEVENNSQMKRVKGNKKRLTKIPDDSSFEESFDNADVSKVKYRQIEKIKLSDSEIDSESEVNNKSQPKRFKRSDSNSSAENELNEAEEHSVMLVNSETNSEVQKSDSQKRRARRNAHLKELLRGKSESEKELLLQKFRKKRPGKELPVKRNKQITWKERKELEKVCFNCRENGHLLAECPLALDDMKQEIGICFKCGSAWHSSRNCHANVEGYPYAKCFICKKQGHITKDCPQNEHGIYPKGGKCNLCENVNHLKKDCPTLKKQSVSEEEIFTLDTINEGKSIDEEIIHDEEMMHEETVKKGKKKRPKTIKFS